MKNERINVRATKEMKLNLDSLKVLLMLRTNDKLSDSEVIRYTLEYCMENGVDFLKYFEVNKRDK